METIRYFLVAICGMFFLSCDNNSNDMTTTITNEYDYSFQFQNATLEKNFFFLNEILNNTEIKELIANNSKLQFFSNKYNQAFSAARNNCSGQVLCIDQLLRLSESDIDSMAYHLSALSDKKPFKDLIDKTLKPSKMYVRYEDESNHDYIYKIWKDSSKAINNILSTYGLGENPIYADIDKVSYNVESQEYRNLISNKLSSIEFSNPLFFQPSLKYAMALLEINVRDEAGRYELLKENENKVAYEAITNIDWDAYDYSLILVLGDSPNSPGDLPNISLGGIQRTNYGMQLFNNGKAPLIVFSGGHVRPFQTQFSEAVEMKKYVIENYSIDESKILIDPHARHTTTNLRNVSRLMFRYGIPINKKALITTSAQHSAYISTSQFFNRNLNELGYMPANLGERINSLELEFIPNIQSLHTDPMDPLDP